MPSAVQGTKKPWVDQTPYHAHKENTPLRDETASSFKKDWQSSKDASFTYPLETALCSDVFDGQIAKSSPQSVDGEIAEMASTTYDHGNLTRALLQAGRVANRVPRVLVKNGPACNSLVGETAVQSSVPCKHAMLESYLTATTGMGELSSNHDNATCPTKSTYDKDMSHSGHCNTISLMLGTAFKTHDSVKEGTFTISVALSYVLNDVPWWWTTFTVEKHFSEVAS